MVRNIATMDTTMKDGKFTRQALVHVDFNAVNTSIDAHLDGGK